MKKSAFVILGIFIFVAAIGLQPTTVKASGIPVIDISNLIQQLTQYLQMIFEFQEMVNQTTELTDQSTQMIEDYKQVLREYNHFLNQIKSIRHMISNQDWSRLMRMINSYYGESKRSVVATMDPESANYDSEIDSVLGNYGHVPRDPNAIKADAQALGIWSDQYSSEVEQDYSNYNLYKDRMRMVSDNAKKDNRFKEDIEKHAMIVGNLGDESDLATLQEIAAENITIMNQNRATLQTTNQILMSMEMQEAIKAAKRGKAREAELTRLKNRKPTKLLGRDRWGTF